MADNTGDVAPDNDGPTQAVAKRVKERKHYTEDCLQDEEIEGRRMFSVEEKLSSDRFEFSCVDEMKGEDFNLKYLQEHGFVNPILFRDKSGLGMRMPSSNFTVNDVRQCVGSRRMLDVMDVTTQKDIEMTMKDWCRYFENENRDKLLNVISLEFSHTKLENYVESPTVVRQVDWVDWVWPRHLKESQTDGTNSLDEMKYPKVQKYCLMSVKGCYTDFHIDFGGTSVWYHILRGKKVFWLIPPTERNVSLYEQWVLSGKQGDVFFGDTVDMCSRVELQSGDTFFIPTGWIHAVYTPEDTLVFGGNFLHNFGIDKQLRIAEVEDLTHVPAKFRYPFYTEILWYVVQRFVQCLSGKNYLTCNEDGEALPVLESKATADPLNLTTSTNVPNSTQVNGEYLAYPNSVNSNQNSLVNGIQPPNGMKLLYPNSDSINREPLKPLNISPNTESNNNSERGSPKNAQREHVHITKFEYEGLKSILKWLQTLPPSKKGIPELIRDPDGLLEDLKLLLQEHKEDVQQLAITGKPVLFWSESKKPRPKPRAGPTSSSSSTKSSKSSSSKNSNNARRRRTRCKKCEACLRADCGDCHFCKDMKKFGGPGRMKQSCISRQCMAPVLPHTACCMICGRDGWDKLTNPPENENSSLMECSQCWEILHPKCLAEKIPDLPMEGCINDDLPNSWECPKCCRNGKPDQIKPRQMKGKMMKNADFTRPAYAQELGNNDMVVGENYSTFEAPHIKLEVPPSTTSEHDCKRILDDEEPLDLGLQKKIKLESEIKPDVIDQLLSLDTSEQRNEQKHILTAGNDIIANPLSYINLQEQSSKKLSVDKEEESTNDTTTAESPEETSVGFEKKSNPVSHVRSCARYPMTWKKAFKGEQGKVLRVKNGNEKVDFRAKARFPSTVTFRKHGTARERLFRSMKGLKKNSELIRQGVLRLKTPGLGKLDDPANFRAFGRGLKVARSVVNCNVPKKLKSVTHSLIDDPQKVMSSEKVFICEKDLEDKLPPPAQKISSMLRNSPNLKKPKYVVRPAPIIEGFPEERRKNSTRAGADNLAVEKEVMLPVFRFLSIADLYACQLVCKTWNRWSVDPRLWTVMDLTRRKITANVLIGIVRRQPVSLNLSWTNVSRRQLSWLVARLPQMKELVLGGCSAASVGALCTCNCPLLKSLDLSWVEGLTDSAIRDLLAPPPDSRPGFIENKTRLRHLVEVKLAGADISDISVRLLAHHLPLLSKLDLSHCHKVTDMGIAVLGAAKSTRLSSLDVSSCSNITDTSLEALKRCTSLFKLDLRDCNQVTEAACAKFVYQNRLTLTMKDTKLIQKIQ